MKSIHKFLFGGLILLLLCSIGFIIHQDAKGRQQDQSISQLIENKGENQIIEKYTRDSVVHTVFKDRIINNTTNEKHLALGKTYADSIQKALKISIDKIDQVTKINGRLEAQLALQTKQTDKGQVLKTHKDQYLDLAYNPETDSLQFAYNLKLNEARYSDKKWLFAPKNNYINVYSDDKRITINGLQSYRIKEDPPNRMGIGISAGYGVGKDGNTLRLVPYVGVGLNYNLIEF